jgi:hypothetical protein
MMRLRFWVGLALLLVVLTRGSAGMSPAVEAAGLMFGDGSDGAITFSSNTQFNPPVDAAVVSGTSGGTAFSVSGASGVFLPGQRILIHQSQGAGVGQWELNTVASFALGNIFTVDPLANTYGSGAQVLVVPEYSTMTIDPSAVVGVKPWNGSTGGILAFLVSGTANLGGILSADGANGINSSASGRIQGAVGGGFRGGDAMQSNNPPQRAYQGEGHLGTGSQNKWPNGNGGGGGGTPDTNNVGSGGGGGGHATYGTAGTADCCGLVGGSGGLLAGTADLTLMVFGGGGGGGWQDGAPNTIGTGGSGGGIIFLSASTINATGAMQSNGGWGGGVTSEFANGGGGAGGAILLRADVMNLNTSMVTTLGGIGGNSSGNGGVGK